MTATSLNQIQERLVRELWPRNFPLVVPIASLNAASTQTALQVDSATAYNLKYSSGDANEYDGVGVYMTAANTTLTAPEGQWGGYVTRGGYAPTTGILTVSPGFSADPNISPTTAPKLLFCYGIHIDDITSAINDIQRSLFLPRYLPFTGMFSATDGDMETSGTTNYTAIAGSTLTKTTTTGQVLYGTQALSVAVTASADGVRTASIPLSRQFEPMYISVPIKLSDATKTAKVALYDATNSADIFSATVTGSDWQNVWFLRQPPSTCENVQVRVTSTVSGSWSIYVDHISMYSAFKSQYATPPAVDDPSHVDAVEYQQLRYLSQDIYTYLSNATEFTPWISVRPLQDTSAVTPIRLDVDRPRWPLFLKFRAKGTAFSGSNALTTEVTYADQELLVEGALGICLDKLGRSKEALGHHRTYYRMARMQQLGGESVQNSGNRLVSVRGEG